MNEAHDLKAGYKFRTCWFDEIEDFTERERADLLGAFIDYHFSRQHKFKSRVVEKVFVNIARTFDSDVRHKPELSAARSVAGRKGAEARMRTLNARKHAKDSVADDVDFEGDDIPGAEFSESENLANCQICQNLPKNNFGKKKQIIQTSKTEQTKETSPQQSPQKKNKTRNAKQGDGISPSLSGSTHNGLAGGGRVGACSPPTLEAWKNHAKQIGWKADTVDKTNKEIEAAYFWYAKTGWKIADWQSACADARVRADSNAGRMSPTTVADIVAKTTAEGGQAPFGWSYALYEHKVATKAFSGDFEAFRQTFKGLTWRELVRTDYDSAIVAMRECLTFSDNKHLLASL